MLFAIAFGLLLVLPMSSSGAQPGFPMQTSAKAILDALSKERDPYWLAAKEIAYKTVPELTAQHYAEILRNASHNKLMRGPRAGRYIALTFDDGPHPKYTPQILEILRRYNVEATFFVVGMMAERYPKLVKAEIGGGHDVGNHTYHHVNLNMTPPAYVATEIKACGEVLDSITGRPPHLFRPPGGDYNDQVAEVSDALGYQMILWTDDPGDYASPGEDVIEQRTLDAASPGGIILIHDGIQQTIDVLPKLIKDLKSQGYEFVTIDEMLRQKGLQGRNLSLRRGASRA
jgi:peptidoglycan/xylan/chitin deacetylase (PgdA/CDA1 family)